MEVGNSDLSFCTAWVIAFYVLISSNLMTSVFMSLFETKELWFITVLLENSFWQVYVKQVNPIWFFF